MALTPQQQSSRLFKKSLGAAETVITKEFYEEPKLGKTNILPSQIWAEADKIPTTAPTLADQEILGVVKYYEKLELAYIAGSTNLSYYNAALVNTIPFNFGDGTYNYRLYQSDGSTQIPFGTKNWLLDTEAGVLTFYDTNQTLVSEANLPKISFYKYVGTTGLPSGSTSGLNVHTAVKLATNSGDTLINYSASTSGYTSLPATIDGVDPSTLSEGSRILVKNQTDAKENGLFVISGSTLVRASDADGTPVGEVVVGDYVFTTSGTTNIATSWVIGSTDSIDQWHIVPGVDTQNWTLFSTSKAYVADEQAIKLINGDTFHLQLSGTTFYGSGLYQDANGLTISTQLANAVYYTSTGLTSLESFISSEITGLTSGINSLEFALSTEISDRTSSMSSLETGLSGAIFNETSSRESVDSALGSDISSLATALTGSTSSLETALSNIENSLGTAISIEVSDRTYETGSLATALSIEISDRTYGVNSLEIALVNFSGVTSQTAGSGLTYNSATTALNVNVDDYTIKIVGDQLRASQLWIQIDNTTTIISGTSGATNIILAHDPITPVQVFVNGVEYLVSLSTVSQTNMPFFFDTLLPVATSILYFDATIAGFGLEFGTDLIVAKYQYVDIVP